MDFPAELEQEIESRAQAEYHNPTTSFGTTLQTLIYNEEGQTLPTLEVSDLNDWQNTWTPDPDEATWADFIRWCIRKIKAWWDSLFS